MKKTYPTYEKAQKMVQEKGIKSANEYRFFYKEQGLPSTPERTYKDNWIDWDTFLGREKKKLSFSYEEAQKLAQEHKIKSMVEYKSFSKEFGLPSAPYEKYKDEWIDWDTFLGKHKKKHYTYEEAQELVQAQGIKSAQEYRACYNTLGLPSNPNRNYKESGWVDWDTFLGKQEIHYPCYEEAQKIVKERGIQSVPEYKSLYMELGLPSHPYRQYKEDGCNSWNEFFGKARRTIYKKKEYKKRGSSNVRKYRILTKLSLSPILLQEDAPLQVLYILASELDRRLAKEMEELLAITTFEERLNWVKEQLEKLKECGTTLSKTIEVTPSDELSAMESLLEEFDLTDKISFTLENYLHSAVNRELISEYDD